MTDRRLLLVHAHPDDETITCGATMAYYAANGARVTLVTCTRGEEGEIKVAALAHLAADREDRLGPYRAGELAAAMRELGVTDHRFLGGPGRYRDSGMMGLPSNDRPECFWRADLDEAAGALVEVIREVEPQVLITYDPEGGYGHPDHIQAHRVAMRAYELLDGDPAQPAKVYWTAIPRSRIEAGTAAMAAAGVDLEMPDDLPFVVDDAEVAAAVDAPDFLAAKAAAMAAHATQIASDDPFFQMADNPMLGVEYYRLVRGTRGRGSGPYGWEDDLFAGLDG
jgi:N-acetyl-1-D-myo-inositol-2-amino-2-deoxy-alpha-D-glucopyranoside deacetylase